jgi:hypothetical protein
VRDQPSVVGICIVRVETQHAGVLITLEESLDVKQRSTKEKISVPDVDAAAEAVREFLRTFIAVSRTSG